VGITIVQPNYEPHYEKFSVSELTQCRRFVDLSISHIDSQTQYLVFPETSFDRIRLNSFRDNRVINLCQSLVDSFPGLRLISGIATYRTLAKNELDGANFRIHVNSEGDSTYWDIQNSAMQLTSNESDYDIYFKSKLVPGPEMFPFRKFLFFLEPLVDQLGGTYEGHTKQITRDVFSGGALHVAPVICYESIYGDYTGGYVRNGATALFIVTNDGWWDNTPGHIQHLKLGTLRAIEHRRPIARSANTGISCFIDIKGGIHQPTKYGETTAIKGALIPETRITFYTIWGDLVAKGAILVFGVFLFGGILAWLFSKTRNVARK
jgi:apolipoprotein N-acyltransferase